MSPLLQFAAGYGYVKVFENFAHKYILHAFGKDKDSIWSFHFHDHHKAASKYGMLDPAYLEPWWLNLSRAKEVGSLAAAFMTHLPLAKKHPCFVAGIGVGIAEYYHKHKKSHLQPEWAWEHMQNHVKHHLVDQENYWGVTSGLMDRLVRTDPKLGDEEWAQLRTFYMRRYHVMKEKAEETAKEKCKEHKENFTKTLDGLTEKLYSFFGNK